MIHIHDTWISMVDLHLYIYIYIYIHDNIHLSIFKTYTVGFSVTKTCANRTLFVSFLLKRSDKLLRCSEHLRTFFFTSLL